MSIFADKEPKEIYVPNEVPIFIQIACAESRYSSKLYALGADGHVYQWKINETGQYDWHKKVWREKK
jgi:hypothetical protein